MGSYLDPEGRDYSPWEKRKRIKPLRTYSGEVIYKRPRHYFSPADLIRIQNKLIDQNTLWDIALDVLRKLIEMCIALWKQTLDILSWRSPWTIYREAPKYLQELINFAVGVDIDPWSDSIVIDMIMILSSKAKGIDVTIKRRP